MPLERAACSSSASAWPRSIASTSEARGSACAESTTAAAHCPRAVSIARMRIAGSASDGFDLLHFGHEVTEEVLDAVLQRGGRGGATRAGALHAQVYLALVEPAIHDVAAVIGDRARRRGTRTGQPVHLQSPLVPAILLLVSLAGVELGDHHKKVLWRALCVSLAMLAVGILVGVIAFG